MPYINASASSGSAGREIGYDQITAGVTVVSTTEATPTTLITCAAHVFDGSAVLLTVFTPNLSMQSGAADSLTITLFESTTEISRLGVFVDPATVNAQNTAFTMLFRFTPTAASHTYLISAHKTGGTAAFGAGTGSGAAYPPAFARFTKV